MANQLGLDPLGALLEPSCNLLHAELVRGDCESEVTQLSARGLNHITFALQPGRHRIHSGSLVPIHETMVEDQALCQRRSWVERGVVEVPVTKRSQWASESRFKQAAVSNAVRTTKLLDRDRVNPDKPFEADQRLERPLLRGRQVRLGLLDIAL
jgi:hypothetical protein